MLSPRGNLLQSRVDIGCAVAWLRGRTIEALDGDTPIDLVHPVLSNLPHQQIIGLWW